MLGRVSGIIFVGELASRPSLNPADVKAELKTRNWSSPLNFFACECHNVVMMLMENNTSKSANASKLFPSVPC